MTNPAIRNLELAKASYAKALRRRHVVCSSTETSDDEVIQASEAVMFWCLRFREAIALLQEEVGKEHVLTEVLEATQRRAAADGPMAAPASVHVTATYSAEGWATATPAAGPSGQPDKNPGVAPEPPP